MNSILNLFGKGWARWPSTQEVYEAVASCGASRLAEFCDQEVNVLKLIRLQKQL